MKYFFCCLIFVFLFAVPLKSFSGSQWNNFYTDDRDFGSPNMLYVADVIIKLQRPTGGWSKRYSPQKDYSKTEFEKMFVANYAEYLAVDVAPFNSFSHRSSTFDNGSTHTHLRFLLRVYLATGSKMYVKPLIDGFNYILNAQYSSGGWPQNFPNLYSYGGFITFNDGAMIGIMTVLKEVVDFDPGFLSSDLRQKIITSFGLGLKFIVDSQIIVDGSKTGWAAQYDPVSLEAQHGRIYEPVSISTAVTSQIVFFLMKLELNDKLLTDTINGSIAWLKKSEIVNKDYIRIKSDKYLLPFEALVREDPYQASYKKRLFQPRGFDVKLVDDASARPLWARFYEIKSNSPIFSDVDGVIKYNISEIGYERRTGYLWYGRWPAKALSYYASNWSKYE